eukprot:CAMPEP_0195070776 /NCGR_PEP_ID=MMETSP0448-20130528/14750_1 /TAXON_ID=66468 /ORGANISM="Heterocapsa triquestra, Strain CCMP 448" /LENGTH=30 /DNA_ID= /DNA_START= /DNA_END= /DNA_ORIENTATION=
MALALFQARVQGQRGGHKPFFRKGKSDLQR